MLSSCVDVARGLVIGRRRDAPSSASCTHVGQCFERKYGSVRFLSQGRVSQEGDGTGVGREKKRGKQERRELRWEVDELAGGRQGSDSTQ